MAKNEVEDRDHGYRATLKRLTTEGAITVGIHESEGAAAKSGAKGEATLVEIAAYHEFGTKTIPRRSFIADWADEKRSDHETQLRQVAQAVVQGNVDSVEQGLERLGNLYVGEVQKRIADGIDPPLAQSTIDRKGSSKPLIDTGQLRSAVTYKVEKK